MFVLSTSNFVFSELILLDFICKPSIRNSVFNYLNFISFALSDEFAISSA